MDTFTDTRVEEVFGEGVVMVMGRDGSRITPSVLLTLEDYTLRKVRIARAEGVNVAEVSLVGRTVTMNEDGILVVPPDSN